MTTISDKASQSYQFYQMLFNRLSVNDLLNRTGKAKLLKDMTSLEYLDYLDMLSQDVADHQKD